MAKKSKLATFDAMRNAMSLNKVMLITHPSKPDSRAEIVVKYPRDGAGKLQLWCADFFGPNGCDEVQYSYAGGYGYDKLTAALSNLIIDGHSLSDHCGQDETSKALLAEYVAAEGEEAKNAVCTKAKQSGYTFSNWTSGGGFMPTGKNGYQSCYKIEGLDYLRALGYVVYTIG